MNFLAHLHIAEHCNSSLLGNLLGDFVKGDPNRQFDHEIVQGIRLHRWVDAYTDNHWLMSQAKQGFSRSTRRYAPIALDMFWDHCLATHWERFHPLTLSYFVDNAQYQVTTSHPEDLPERYLRVANSMWRGKWLESYADFDNIQYALERMSLRSERMSPLANCFDSLSESYPLLEGIFFQLYPDVLEKAKSAQL